MDLTTSLAPPPTLHSHNVMWRVYFLRAARLFISTCCRLYSHVSLTYIPLTSQLI